jgi:hypothetical protein
MQEVEPAGMGVASAEPGQSGLLAGTQVYTVESDKPAVAANAGRRHSGYDKTFSTHGFNELEHLGRFAGVLWPGPQYELAHA